MLTLRKDAERDLRDSYLWYESKSKNLGKRFIFELEIIFEKIQNNPLNYQAVFNNIRRALCMRFPYSIYFKVDNEDIVVIAILHQKRNPEILNFRIPDKYIDK